MSFKQLCEGGRNGHMNSRKLNVSRRFCFCCFSIRLFGKSCFSGKNLPITQCLNFSQERFYKVILLRFWFSNTLWQVEIADLIEIKGPTLKNMWWCFYFWYYGLPSYFIPNFLTIRFLISVYWIMWDFLTMISVHFQAKNEEAMQFEERKPIFDRTTSKTFDHIPTSQSVNNKCMTKTFVG